jgi:hypothetical protein
VARFIAQVFSAVNPQCRDLLQTSREEKIRHLEEKDVEFRSSL